MKTVYRIIQVINIVMLLIMITACIMNKNIHAVSGWVIALAWYLRHLKDEAEYDILVNELKNAYEIITRRELNDDKNH